MKTKTLKWLSLLMIAVLSAGFASCEDESDSDSDSDSSSISGSINGYDYVDLGLSVKWATCNVGAYSPEEYGYDYAWGETAMKPDYSSSNSLTYGKSMSDISGNRQYDAARANWGGSWRLPTKAEMEELMNEDLCKWTWTTQGGNKGYRVKSKKNGKSIFLPAAGWRLGTSLRYAGKYGYYWTSTPDESDTWQACGLGFNSSNQGVVWNDRDYGYSVRPVSE